MSAWQQTNLAVSTCGRQFHPLTHDVEALVAKSGLRVGLCHLFLRHTSASLFITENADPEVRRDLERWARQLAPDGAPFFEHDAEGLDDMPAHARTVLAGHELTVPIRDGRLALGTWQGVYLWEHRAVGHRREIVVTLSGAA